ncbi:MAG TPA: PH domain-containing protein [Bacteroidia bacterium]|nr:PH domain-containing protein [Bacteroidia bacterium]
MEFFKATLDSESVSSTIMSLLPIIMGIGILVMRKMKDLPKAGKRTLLYTGLFLLVVSTTLTITGYIYCIKGYRVTTDKLIIQRPFEQFNVETPLADIKEVRLLNDSEMIHTERPFGNDGLFGYTGNYRNPKLGDFKKYATSRKNLLLVTLKGNGEKYIITPDNISLMDTLNNRILKK